MKITESEEQKKKEKKKYKKSLSDLWDIIKWISAHILGVPEKEDKKKGAERILVKIMAENFPNFMKHMNINNQEAQQTWE